MLLADIDFAEVLWSILVLYFIFVYFMALFTVIGDLFRDREMSGVMKAVWFILLLVFPILSLLVYLIARGDGMAQRSMAAAREAQAGYDSYVRSVAGGGGPASELASAKAMLDAGDISADEFASLKAKILST